MIELYEYGLEYGIVRTMSIDQNMKMIELDEYRLEYGNDEKQNRLKNNESRNLVGVDMYNQPNGH